MLRSEDCTDNMLSTCTDGCAALVEPLWTACKDELRKLGGDAAFMLMEAADQLCSATFSGHTHDNTVGGAGGKAVREFAVTCPVGAVAQNCAPKCNAAINGDLLLLNIDGDDAKLTCKWRIHTA